MQTISDCTAIEDCIRRYADDAESCFVFPSRIAARLWLFRALSLTGLPALPAEMFSAWDAFKMNCCAAQQEGFRPASQILRLLFALHITELNAQKPFFSVLIPPIHARNGSIFAQWLAGILPQLDHWEKRQQNAAKHAVPEADDLQLLKQKYTEFLERQHLFEPSWVGAAFTPHAKRYIIFYPELMEDFSEYRELLQDRAEIFILPTLSLAHSKPPLTVFNTIRNEIRTTVLRIESLLSAGVLADSIAVSVADLPDVHAYLKRECALRAIPVEFRLGFKLGEQQAGRLFTQLERCIEERYSFESMKTLLHNAHIPWKNKDAIKAFINFGIRNNCLVSWTENNARKNVWLEAFKQPISPQRHHFEEELWERDTARSWFKTFMQNAERLVHAESFSEVQKNYFLFRKSCIDVSAFSQEDDAVMGRCISVLQELSLLDAEYADYLPKKPFRFFTARLDNELYVPQNSGTAVSVFPFRVAAATPFEHHFILNCTEKASRVLYQKLPFLRKDAREALGVTETDASSSFFAVYAAYGQGQFSCSEQTFSGFSIAQNLFETQKVFSAEAAAAVPTEDSFAAEYGFFTGTDSFPAAVYPVQKQGFNRFDSLKEKPAFSFITQPFAGKLPELSQVLAHRYEDTALYISQTDLSRFSRCAVLWFLQAVLSVGEADTDAELFNPRYIGLTCHKVLELLYKKINETDTVFIAEKKEVYAAWARELLNSLAYTQTDFRGPLAAPFIESLKKRVMDSVNFVLNFDAEKLNGFQPLIMEEELRFMHNSHLFRGKIDRISYRAADDTAVILDYKTGAVPSAADYKSEPMQDFQIPMYLFLSENSRFKTPVEHAFFLDITNGLVKYIVNDAKQIDHGKSRSAVTREKFEPAVQQFLTAAEDFAAAAEKEDFQKQPSIQWNDCMQCQFHQICRTAFIVK